MTRGERIRRLLIALVVAPLLGAIWASSVFVVLMAFSGMGYREPEALAPLFGLALQYASLWTFALTATIGFAWHAIACALGWRNLASYAGFGACLGALPTMLLPLVAVSLPTIGAVALFLWASSTGAIIGGAAWLIRRPDRDTASSQTEN